MIHPITVQILDHAIKQAERDNADLILLRINTPGGLAEATRQIIQKIVASPVPVVTYVTPSGGRAASAGFFILQAGGHCGHGAGHEHRRGAPVLLGGQMDPVMKQKVENDAAASVAQPRLQARPQQAILAEKTVLESKSFTEKEALEDNLIEIIATRRKRALPTSSTAARSPASTGASRRCSSTAPQVTEYRRHCARK